EPRPACDPDRVGVVEGFPGGADGGLAEFHAGLVGRAVRLPRVARDAGERAVLPGGETPLGTRNDVVDRQLFGTRPGAAVLAGVVVSLEEVPAAECHGVLAGLVVVG